MPSSERHRASIALLCALTALACAPSPAGASSRARTARASAHALLSSRLLWATINVCSPGDQPDTVGIRGSMPGDGTAADRLYMRFRLQYFEAKSGHWVDLASSRTSGYVAVGAAAAARQGGRSFQLEPVAARLRGVVDFQWRHGRTVLVGTSRPTTAGHRAAAGADPPGFSAASCLLG